MVIYNIINTILCNSLFQEGQTSQCCCQGLEPQGQGQGQGVKLQGLRTRTWKLVLGDPRGQGLSSRTTTQRQVGYNTWCI